MADSFFSNWQSNYGFSPTPTVEEIGKQTEYVQNDPVRRLQRRVNEMNLQNELKNAPMIQSMFQNLFQGQGTPSGGPTATPTSPQPSNAPGVAGGGPQAANPDQIGAALTKLDNDYTQTSEKMAQKMQQTSMISGMNPAAGKAIIGSIEAQQKAVDLHYQNQRRQMIAQMPKQLNTYVMPDNSQIDIGPGMNPPEGARFYGYRKIDPKTGQYEGAAKEQAEPGSDFKTFSEGMRDELIQNGVTNKGAQDRAISKEWEAIQLKLNEAKTGSRYDNLTKSVFDKETGNIKMVTNKEIRENEDRYLSPQDPDVKQLNNNGMFETANRRFVSMIDKNLKTVEAIEKKYGGNKNIQLLNTPLNKLQGMIGSGDLASLKLVLNSLSAEVGKVESGSLGIRGVDVSTFDKFKASFSENMPFKELSKVMQTGKNLGTNRISSIIEEKARIKEQMGAKLNAEEKKAIQPEKSEGEIELAPGVTIK